MKKQFKLTLLAIVITLLPTSFANASVSNGDFSNSDGLTLSQTLNLKAGENYVSFYLLPENMSFKNILKPLIEDNSLKLVLNGTGDIFWPDEDIDDIGSMKVGKGYIIKMKNDATLTIEGVAPNYPISIELEKGRTLIGYPTVDKIDAMELVERLIADDKLEEIQDLKDDSSIYYDIEKEAWIDEIGKLLPGKAYEINVNTDTNIIIEKPFYCGDTIEYEDQEYATTQISDRCWMADNLNVGEKINGKYNQSNNQIIEKYCINNNEANCDKYGGLYQWREAMGYSFDVKAIGICPEDWHIPSDYEWYQMESYIDPEINSRADRGFRGVDAGEKLKENGETGFNAKITGYRYAAVDQPFMGFEVLTYFWTSTKSTDDDAWARTLNSQYKTINRNKYPYTWLGYSVRCIKDVE